MRHPGYGMDDRLMLERINYDDWTVKPGLGRLPAEHHAPADHRPRGALQAVCARSSALVDEYVDAFGDSQSAAPAPGLHLPARQHLSHLQRQPAVPRLHPADGGRRLRPRAPRRQVVLRQGADGLRRRRGQERLGERRRERAGHDVVPLVRQRQPLLRPRVPHVRARDGRRREHLGRAAQPLLPASGTTRTRRA